VGSFFSQTLFINWEGIAMRAMILTQPGQPLQLQNISIPEPGPNQIRVKVHTCGVCRTDLHLVDGELPNPKLPIVPGHEIIGTIDKLGTDVANFQLGDRVGIPWLGWTCGQCRYCLSGRENLCDYAKFTGYTLDGGYAEYTLADSRYCFNIPPEFDDLHAAPLLCAGLIGYRSYRMTENAQSIGLYGFGASAHLIAQVALFQGKRVYAFTRPGDLKGQEFARQVGVTWAGGSDEAPPEPLDAAILFAPVGALVPEALKHLRKGGIVVCAGFI
jgi:propanol-preferring alcohol dehydrogenase